MDTKDSKSLKEAFISHIADDKANFASLISLTTKTQEAFALISQDIGYMKENIKEIKEIMNSRYVSRDEFEPIKKIVYGVVGLLLTAIVVALVALVLK